MDIIRRMVRMYPNKALRIFDMDGRSPLHSACEADRPSLEMIRYLVNECQALCLLLDNYNKSPYDLATLTRRPGIPAENLFFLMESMKDAAIAFMVCSSQGMITLTPAATAQIQRVLLPDFATQGFSRGVMSTFKTFVYCWKTQKRSNPVEK
jgi:hypothetical protein